MCFFWESKLIKFKWNYFKMNRMEWNNEFKVCARTGNSPDQIEIGLEYLLIDFYWKNTTFLWPINGTNQTKQTIQARLNR